MKRLAAAIAMLCSVATFTAPARAQAPADAQNYPNQMVKIIVAISPGSAADLLARAAAELLDSGQVRGLAVTGPSRVPLVPKVPTFAEAGLPEFSYDTWFGVWAPAGTPDPIVQKVSRDLIAVMSEPEMKERLSKQGMVIATKPAKEFNEMVKADSARFISALRAVEKK